jgi:hypothetical protein
MMAESPAHLPAVPAVPTQPIALPDPGTPTHPIAEAPVAPTPPIANDDADPAVSPLPA